MNVDNLGALAGVVGLWALVLIVPLVLLIRWYRNNQRELEQGNAELETLTPLERQQYKTQKTIRFFLEAVVVLALLIITGWLWSYFNILGLVIILVPAALLNRWYRDYQREQEQENAKLETPTPLERQQYKTQKTIRFFLGAVVVLALLIMFGWLSGSFA